LFLTCVRKYRGRVHVADQNKREEKEARKRERLDARRCQSEGEAEELLVQKSRRVGPVTRLCTRGPLPLSARGGLISRPYRIRHDNRPNIHTNAVPEAPTVQRGPPMREATESSRWVRDLSVLSSSLALLPVRRFLPLTSRVLKCCWVLTVSRETNALPSQNKSWMLTKIFPRFRRFWSFSVKYKLHSRVFNNHLDHAIVPFFNK